MQQRGGVSNAAVAYIGKQNGVSGRAGVGTAAFPLY